MFISFTDFSYCFILIKNVFPKAFRISLTTLVFLAAVSLSQDLHFQKFSAWETDIMVDWCPDIAQNQS